MCTELTAQVINDLFKKLIGLFPSCLAIFKSENDLDNCRISWFQAFRAHGIVDQKGNIDLEAIIAGVRKCEILNQPFIPSCGQFIALCQKDSLLDDDTEEKKSLRSI